MFYFLSLPFLVFQISILFFCRQFLLNDFIGLGHEIFILLFSFSSYPISTEFIYIFVIGHFLFLIFITHFLLLYPSYHLLNPMINLQFLKTFFGNRCSHEVENRQVFIKFEHKFGFGTPKTKFVLNFIRLPIFLVQVENER